jgi:hypothetical protein
MQMRPTLTTILLLFLTATLFGQKAKKEANKSPWSDTTFILVKLNDTISDKKVAAIDIGKKAIIYVKVKPMMDEAKGNLSNDFVKDNYQKIITYFSSASPMGDTILVSEYLNLSHLEYLVAHLLIAGNAKVFYKKQNAFVETISHRLERYGGNADRFFYLPDKRPFFAVKEYSGILDDDNPFGKGHYEAYVKEGEKLLSLREQ